MVEDMAAVSDKGTIQDWRLTLFYVPPSAEANTMQHTPGPLFKKSKVETQKITYGYLNPLFDN